MIPILLVLSVLSLQPFTAPWCYHISPSFFLFKSLRVSQFSPSKPPRFSSHIFRQMPSWLCEGEWHSPTLWGRGWSVATCKIVWNNWDSLKISSLQTFCCSTTFHSSPQMRLSISLQAVSHGLEKNPKHGKLLSTVLFQGSVRTSKANFTSQVSLSQLPSDMYFASVLTGSQNCWDWRQLWRSTGPSPLLMTGSATSIWEQPSWTLDYLWGGRLHSLSGNQFLCSNTLTVEITKSLSSLLLPSTIYTHHLIISNSKNLFVFYLLSMSFPH